jgi:2'-5' RNA ligase
MPWAVELQLDAVGEEAVHRLWHVLAATGVRSVVRARTGPYRPHVTLLVCDTLAPAPAVAALHPLRDAAPPTLQLAFLGLFPGPTPVLFLGVVPTAALLALQRRAFAALAPLQPGPWSYSHPDVWVPHCTLALPVAAEELCAATRVLPELGQALPIVSRAQSLRIVNVTTGAVTAVGRFAAHTPDRDDAWSTPTGNQRW